MSAPTMAELFALCSLCSDTEWNDVLSTDLDFIEASTRSLADTERAASALLGRKISVSQPSLQKSGDNEL